MKILNPVMRMLGAADLARTFAFYRDVLGFEVQENEARLGPARLHFGSNDFAPEDWDTPWPTGSAMLFFQTDDLDAMHSAIRNRGGQPGEIEKLNWIKLRVFTVRDPDGHTLWFAQSYGETDQPKTGMMQQALPEMPCSNVAAAIAHYRDVLGFRVNYRQEDLGVMDRDKITILLIQRTEQHTGIGSFEVYVENADALHAELKSRGANLQGEPVSHPWGLRDFRVLDLEGNRITFGQPFE